MVARERERGTREIDRSVGRNEDKGGQPRLAIASFHSEALFTSFARQTDEPENSAERETLRFRVRRCQKEENAMCVFSLVRTYLRYADRRRCRHWRPVVVHPRVLALRSVASIFVSPFSLSLSLFPTSSLFRSLFRQFCPHASI